MTMAQTTDAMNKTAPTEISGVMNDLAQPAS
jgi:hypothetical protein